MADASAIQETKWSLRTMAIIALAVWAAIWVFFLAIRFSGFDIRLIPGIGPVMLLLLGLAGISPLAASVLALLAVIQRPSVPLNWITLVCAVAALLGQAALFAASRWM
jgi:hypothetical protein